MSAILTVRNAAENASADPVTAAGIVAILRGTGGTPSQTRAVFGDVSLPTLSAAAEATGTPWPAVLAAYCRARHTMGAANPALDALLTERDAWARAPSPGDAPTR